MTFTCRSIGMRTRRQGSRGRQLGQAMIEYIVVLSFGVMLLIKASGNEEAPVKQLATAIKNYHKHYTYAMAIAYIPECDFSQSYDKSVDNAYIGTLTGSTTVSGDRCIDWQNPSLPDITLNASFSLAANDLTSAIQTIMTDMVNGALQKFIHPELSLSDISFSPGDFF